VLEKRGAFRAALPTLQFADKRSLHPGALICRQESVLEAFVESHHPTASEKAAFWFLGSPLRASYRIVKVPPCPPSRISAVKAVAPYSVLARQDVPEQT